MADNKCMAVFIEQRQNTIQPVSYELLGEARRLLERRQRPWTITALVLGNGLSESQLESLIEYGADKVLYMEDSKLESFDTIHYTDALESLIKETEPEAFLIGGTMLGRDLAPRISARIHTGLTADATDIDFEDDAQSDVLHITRPAFGGNLYATIACENHTPQMASIRPGVFERIQRNPSRKGTIEKRTFNSFRPTKVQTIEVHKKETVKDTIDKANIIVSAGRGVKECLHLVRDVAAHVQGDVGGSRALVDEGLIEKTSQVGQTGTTVRPTIYLACGISGAIQHIAGMDKSETIIAINTDPDAPIFNVADLGIVGDAKPILDALKKQLSS
ncbi:MAG: electron transfer flavoprotein subunit alpha/FixB family protein [Candidatus Izemoplasmataceae bacterium]